MNKTTKKWLYNIRRECKAEKKAEIAEKIETDRDKEYSYLAEQDNYENKADRVLKRMLMNEQGFNIENLKYNDVKNLFLFQMITDGREALTDNSFASTLDKKFTELDRKNEIKEIRSIEAEEIQTIFDFSKVEDWFRDMCSWINAEWKKNEYPPTFKAISKIQAHLAKVFTNFAIHRLKSLFKNVDGTNMDSIIDDYTANYVDVKFYNNHPILIDGGIILSELYENLIMSNIEDCYESYILYADKYIDMCVFLFENFIVEHIYMLYKCINIHNILNMIDEVLDMISLLVAESIATEEKRQTYYHNYRKNIDLHYLENIKDHQAAKADIFEAEKKVDNSLTKEIEDDKKKPKNKQLYDPSSIQYLENIPDKCSNRQLRRIINYKKSYRGLSDNNEKEFNGKIKLLEEDFGENPRNNKKIVGAYRAIFLSEVTFDNKQPMTIYSRSRKSKKNIPDHHYEQEFYFYYRLFERENFYEMGILDQFEKYTDICQKHRAILLRLYNIYFDKRIIHSIYDVSFFLFKGLFSVFECIINTPSDWESYKTELKKEFPYGIFDNNKAV